nr:MAG TPA: hypothetical protein [Caudoviricetes sp.]
MFFNCIRINFYLIVSIIYIVSLFRSYSNFRQCNSTFINHSGLTILVTVCSSK